jgi:hypothetical protein
VRRKREGGRKGRRGRRGRALVLRPRRREGRRKGGRWMWREEWKCEVEGGNYV